MAIFLKTNTKDKKRAIDAALKMAVFYDADVCMEQGDDGYWQVVLKASNLEVPMVNIGKKREQDFLSEAQERLKLFNGDIQFTELSFSRGISNSKESLRLSNDWRICLLFTIDRAIANVPPVKFAEALHNDFFSQSEMHVAYSDAEQFEIRIWQKAFFGFKDAKLIWQNIKASMDKMGDIAKGIICHKLMSDSNPVTKADYPIPGERINLVRLLKTHRFDPIYLDDANKAEWLSRVLKIEQINVNFKSTVYASSDLELDRDPLLSEKVVKMSVIRAEEHQDGSFSYQIRPEYLSFIADPNNGKYLGEMLSGQIVGANLIGQTENPNEAIKLVLVEGIETTRIPNAVSEGNPYCFLARIIVNAPDLKRACFENRVRVTITKSPAGEMSLKADLLSETNTDSPSVRQLAK